MALAKMEGLVILLILLPLLHTVEPAEFIQQMVTQQEVAILLHPFTELPAEVLVVKAQELVLLQLTLAEAALLVILEPVVSAELTPVYTVRPAPAAAEEVEVEHLALAMQEAQAAA